MKPRYEFKYLITLDKSAEFLRQLEEVMVPDPKFPRGYRVNSIYYDTDDFQFYFDKLDGVDPRYKIRLRWYGDEPDTWLFAEAKHRRDQLVSKERIRLPVDLLPNFFEERDFPLALPDYALEGEELGANILQKTLLRQPLVSRCLVRYFRRIFVTPTNPNLRVTLDTDLRALGVSELEKAREQGGFQFCPADLCVLEIKFNYAMPLWLADLTRSTHLGLRRYSKYCSAVEALYPQVGHREVRRQASAFC